MAKFSKTPHLYGPGGIYEDLTCGRIKLQTGQWLRADATDPKPGRFVGIEGHHVNIIWPNGPYNTGKVSAEAFQSRAKGHQSWKEARARLYYELEFNLANR